MFGLRNKWFTKKTKAKEEVSLALPESRPLIRKEDLQLVTETRDQLLNEVSEIRDIASSLVQTLNSELESVRWRMETLLDCMPDSMVMTKFSGEILSINDAAERLLGLTEQQAVGAQIETFVRLDRFHAVSETLRLNCSDYSSYISQQTTTKLEPIEARKLYAAFMKDHPVFGESLSASISTRSGIRKSADVVVNILNPETPNRDSLVLMFHIRDTTEKREVFSKLDSLTQFQLGLLSAIPNPVYYFNKDGEFAGCNPAYTKFLESTDTTKLPIEMFIPEKERDEYLEFKLTIRSMPTGEVAHFKTRTTIGNTVREVIIYASALRDSHNVFNGFVATIVDLTPMLEARKFQETLIDAVPNPIYFVDSGLKISGCNSAFESLVSCSRTDMLGKTVSELLLSELANSAQMKRLDLDHRARDFELFSGKVSQLSCETQIYNKAKSALIDVMQSSRALYRNGLFDGMITVLTDITETKEVQRFQRRLFESMPHPVFYKDASLRYVGCNEAYADLFSLSVAEIVGKNREEVFQYIVTLPSSSIAYQTFFNYREHFAKVMHELSSKDLELMSCVNAGTVQTVEMTIYSIAHSAFRSYVFYRTGVYANGEFKGIIGSMMDITPIKNAVSTKTALLETSPNAVIMRDSKGVVVDCNSAFEEMVGTSLIAMSGKTLLALNLVDYEPTISHSSRETAHSVGGTVYEMEAFSCKHKQMRSFVVYYNELAADGLSGSICIWNDVSDIKQAAKEIAEREAQLEVVVNASPDLITCEDLHGNLLLQNKAFHNFFTGNFAVDRGRFDELQRALNAELLARPDSKLRKTVGLQDALGILHHLDVFKSVVQVKEDAKILTVSTDVSHLITHLIQTKTLSTALNNIKEFVVITDARGCITFMNWTFHTKLGIEPSSCLDVPAHSLFDGLPALANFNNNYTGLVTLAGTKHLLSVNVYGIDLDTEPTYILILEETNIQGALP